MQEIQPSRLLDLIDGDDEFGKHVIGILLVGQDKRYGVKIPPSSLQETMIL